MLGKNPPSLLFKLKLMTGNHLVTSVLSLDLLIICYLNLSSYNPLLHACQNGEQASAMLARTSNFEVFVT